METVAKGFIRWILSYIAVLFVIMFLPVFLLTRDFAAFDRVVNYVFNNEIGSDSPVNRVLRPE